MCKKLLSLLLAGILLLTVVSFGVSATGEVGEYEGKLIVLHTNDVHGSIEGYAYLAALKKSLEADGADVLLVDAGDFSQGSTALELSQGAAAVELMNAVGYDVIVPGNHDFDYNNDVLRQNLLDAEFKVICANLYKDGVRQFDANVMVSKGGVNIGFFGLLTPETMTSANPAGIKGLSFVEDNSDPYLYECAQKQANALRTDGADLVICLSHIGVAEASPYKSADLYRNTSGINFIIDGHSHTTMTSGAEGEPIQSTGTNFENIGMLVIDEATGKIESNRLIPMDTLTEQDPDILAMVLAMKDDVVGVFGAVFGESKVELNGDRAPGNRTEETNLGDLITDAMMWFVTEKNPNTVTKVPKENVLVVINGGGVRAPIHKGDITRDDIHTVLPFGNILQVIYVDGETLLRSLECSTYDTPNEIGAFPQVSGINFTIDCTADYDPMESPYPNSTYYGPNSINRVSIQNIGGKAFDPEATYAVITHDFIAAGGDTYYEFSTSNDIIDTGFALDAVVTSYIQEKLGGVVGEEYAQPKGRITEFIEETSTDDDTKEEEKPADKADKDEASPQTGDTTDATVWILICSSSLVALMITASRRRADKKQSS